MLTPSTYEKDESRENAIAVIDLGGQYCHMIGRRLRDIGIRSDIFENDVESTKLVDYAGVILSGGPQSVYAPDAPNIDDRILSLGVPVLGICYGHQLLAKLLGSDVEPGDQEFGKSLLRVSDKSSLFASTPSEQVVWMSHGDAVTKLAADLVSVAETNSCANAAFADDARKLYGVQFHPEVAHTAYGERLLENFSRHICRIHDRENAHDRVTRLTQQIRAQAGDKSVFFFVSGGVDSTVAFALCAKALGRDRVMGVYVDTGLMRKHETLELRELLHDLGLDDRLVIRGESARFLAELANRVDPEDKRKAIGRMFVDVQNQAMIDFNIEGEHWMLGQGTIYPDTIESGGSSGTTALIKTHHNRCAEIRKLIEDGRVIEPLVEFYKDEVREIGAELGLDVRLTGRWPFPGPGLAIRCLCSEGSEPATPIALSKKYPEYKAVQFPVRSVGVQGDGRTYRQVVALQGPLVYDRLQEISTEICNESRLHNRVVVMVAGNANALEKAKVVPAKLTKTRLELLREADDIMRTTMVKHDLTNAVWQFPTVLIPVSMDGGETIILRPVNSEDGMTADFGRIPVAVLTEMGDRIRELPGIDAVFLDVSDKPPATIEWE